MNAIPPSFLILSSLAIGAIAGPATSVAPGSTAFGAERPSPRLAPHAVRQHEWTIPFPPERIFPLLCPTREYDWIPSWRARMIHSESGVAEAGCIFETRNPVYGPMTWICTRYDPSSRIEYTNFAQLGLIMRLQITLSPAPEGTRVIWARSWHATTPEGEAWLARWDDKANEANMRRLQAELDYYLRHGTALRE